MFRTTKSPTTGPAGLLRLGCFSGFWCLIPQLAQSCRMATVAMVMVRVMEDTEHRMRRLSKPPCRRKVRAAHGGESIDVVGRFP
jgi:hypothetical protein